MKLNKKGLYLLPLLLFLGFSLVFSQAKEKETMEPTPFELRCSVCHSLERVRLEVEKIIKDMHHKAGIKLSEGTIREIENSFTLVPKEEPHQELFQEKCAKCHSLAMVVKAHQTKDDAEMVKIIQRMAEKEKSGISKEEVEKIYRSMNMLNEIYEKDVEVKPEQKK